jgi:hypothetical protein
MLAPVPLSWLVLVRTFMHWATTALPLLAATPLLAELLHLPRAQLPVLLASLALGTPLLSLLGAVVAALTVGMRRSGILVALLVVGRHHEQRAVQAVRHRQDGERIRPRRPARGEAVEIRRRTELVEPADQGIHARGFMRFSCVLATHGEGTKPLSHAPSRDRPDLS